MTAFTLRQNRERGLSGIMRAKNEAQFIGACIDSCIDAWMSLLLFIMIVQMTLRRY